jgi:hypothetical protein
MGIFLIGLFLAGIAALLAFPAFPRADSRSWLRYLTAMLASFAGVMVPLAFFFLDSVYGTPSWKGACKCGWIDGFHQGKLALTPIVLFATGALYSLEVARPFGNEPSRSCRIGIYCGAFTSIACLGFGMLCVPQGPGFLQFALGYLSVWYCWRAVQINQRPMDLVWATLGMLPFWLTSAYWSRLAYLQIPDSPSTDCFVVTAAARGHRQLVGPFAAIEHNGRSIQANKQLMVFWRFEDAWRGRYPLSHRLGRKFYNRFGPLLAARLRSPLAADALYLMLKPFQWIAACCTHYHRD